MSYWDGTKWIDERSRHPKPIRPQSRVRDWLATGVMILAIAAIGYPQMNTLADTPSITMKPAVGQVGTRVTLQVNALPQGGKFQVTWDGSAAGMPAGVSSGKGQLKLRFVVPSTSLGQHSVAVMTSTPDSGKLSRSTPPVLAGFVLATASFMVMDPPPPPVETASPIPIVSTAPTTAPSTAPTPAPPAATPAPPAATPAPPAATPAPPAATPAPPAATPAPPAAGCTRIASVAANGITDVTAALAADIAATPANGTFCLLAGGVYRVDGQLHFRNRSGLTVQGNGATLRQTVELNTAMFLFDQGGNDIHLRNFVIQGGNTRTGTYRAGFEYGHGIQFGGVVRASVDHVVFRNMVGEAVYMSGGMVGSSFRESDGISLTNNVVDGTGRMGMAITDGANHVTIQGNSFARIPLYAFDIEPNGHAFNGVAVGAHDVVFAYNTYAAGSIPHMVSLGGNGQVYNITIRGNHSTGSIRTSIGGTGPRVHDVVIDGNIGNISTPDYAVELRNADRIQVLNNQQPLRSGQPLVSQSNCTAVTVSGNT